MSVKKIIIIVGVLSLLIIVVSLVFRFFAPNIVSQLLFNIPLFNRSTNTVILPIPVDHPELTAARLSYLIETDVTEVTRRDDLVELKVSAKISNLPPIVLGSLTEVYIIDSQNIPRRSNKLEIRQGDKVRIFLSYGLRVQDWFVNRVNILRYDENTTIPNQPESTISANR